MGWSPLPKTVSECQSSECKFPLMREATTMKATTIGIDMAKLRIPAKLNSHSGQREHPDP